MLSPFRRFRLRRTFATSRITEFGLSPDGAYVSRVVGDSLIIGPAERPGVTSRTWRFPDGISGHAWLPGTSPMLCVTSAERVLLIDGAGVTPIGISDPVLLDPDHVRGRGVLVRSGSGPCSLHHVFADGTVRTLDAGADVDRWLVDPDERLCAAVRWEPDGTLIVLRPGDPWAEVLRIPPEEALLTYPVDVTADGRGLLLHGPFGSDFSKVLRLDLADGGLAPVISVPGRDIDSLWLHPRRRTIQFLELSGPRPVHQVVDEGVRPDLERLAASESGSFRIVARAADDRRWLIARRSDREPDRHVLWDRDHRRAVALQPPANQRRTAGMLPFSFTAGDGLPIGGYLTLPPRRALPAPLVLLVHGGPWACDEWGHSPEAQWLAGAGYVCLQVNFRGSEGRGRRFMDAADRDWGGRMQQDLLDAVDWAVARGYGDRNRLFLMGTSYGGYAALTAATAGERTFRAAVAVCAPSDLVAWMEHVQSRRHHLAALFRHRLGDPVADRDRLRRQSPLTYACRARTPLLLVHGEQDTLVPLEQTTRMAAALREHRKPHRVLTFPGEGHGVESRSGRIRLATAVERFFRAERRR
jgi:dienelactone hydrolase